MGWQLSWILRACVVFLALLGPSHAHATIAIAGRVVYVGNDGNLSRLDLATEQSLRLLSGAGRTIHNPVWSPDGTQIAYLAAPTIAQPGRLDDIYVMAADGTGTRRVSQQGQPLHDLAWFPDGQRLLFGTGFNGGFQAHVLRLEDLTVGEFVAPLDATITYIDELGPRVSPDGRFVAVLRATAYADGTSRQSIVVWNADGQDARTLVDFGPDTYAFLSTPEWTPDGDIVYGTQDGSIILVSLDGSGPRTVARVGTDVGPQVLYSPDRSRIAAPAVRASRPTSFGSLSVWGLLLVDQDGANAQILGDDDRELSPSARLQWAGADILLFSVGGPRSALMSVQKDGTGVAQVVALDQEFSGFDWHP